MDSHGRKIIVCDNGTGVSQLFLSIPVLFNLIFFQNVEIHPIWMIQSQVTTWVSTGVVCKRATCPTFEEENKIFTGHLAD